MPGKGTGVLPLSSGILSDGHTWYTDKGVCRRVTGSREGSAAQMQAPSVGGRWRKPVSCASSAQPAPLCKGRGRRGPKLNCPRGTAGSEGREGGGARPSSRMGPGLWAGGRQSRRVAAGAQAKGRRQRPMRQGFFWEEGEARQWCWQHNIVNVAKPLNGILEDG